MSDITDSIGQIAIIVNEKDLYSMCFNLGWTIIREREKIKIQKDKDIIYAEQTSRGFILTHNDFVNYDHTKHEDVDPGQFMDWRRHNHLAEEAYRIESMYERSPRQSAFIWLSNTLAMINKSSEETINNIANGLKKESLILEKLEEIIELTKKEEEKPGDERI